MKKIIHEIQEMPIGWCPISDLLPKTMFTPITIYIPSKEAVKVKIEREKGK